MIDGRRPTGEAQPRQEKARAARKIADLGEPMDVRKPKFVQQLARVPQGICDYRRRRAHRAARRASGPVDSSGVTRSMPQSPTWTQEIGSGDGPQAYARLAMHDCLANRLDRHSRRQLRAATAREPAETDRDGYGSRARPMIRWLAKRHRLGCRIAYARRTNVQVSHRLRRGSRAWTACRTRSCPTSPTLSALPATGGPVERLKSLPESMRSKHLQLDNDRNDARAASFTLRQMSNIGVGLDRASLRTQCCETRASTTLVA